MAAINCNISRAHNDERNKASKLTHIRSFYNVRYQIGRKYTYMIINITDVIGLIRNSQWKNSDCMESMI